MKNKRLISIFFQFLLSWNIFSANLVLDPNSNQNTSLDKSQTGIPIVNIATPNHRGVSVNNFLEYNVGKEGQVLNNADNVGRSHLAGLINSNPNLGPHQAANLAVIQVNGANRSDIEGYIEALSREKLNVILSNENGIYLNGAGTINIKNFTATTGKVNFVDGNVKDFDVEKGKILIGDKGFDLSSTDKSQMLSKLLEIQGKLVAGEKLDLVTGEHTFDMEEHIKNKDKKGGTLVISGDMIGAGSMYANQIKIHLTDKNSLLNMGGIFALKQNLEITAEGKVKVKNVQGNGINIKAKEYEQTNSGLSQDNIKIDAQEIKLAGDKTQAEKEIVLKGNVENLSNIYTKEFLETKDLINTGNIATLKDIKANNVNNTGEIVTNSKFTADNVKTTNKLVAVSDISVKNLENSGVVGTSSTLNINGKLNNTKDIQASRNIKITGNAENTGEIVTGGSFTAKDTKTTTKLLAKENIAVGNLTNEGLVTTEGKLDIAGSLKNTKDIEVEKSIKVFSDILNTGNISTNLTLTGKNTINSGDIKVKEKINIDNLTNSGNILTNSSLVAKDIKNTKNIFVKDDISSGAIENKGIVHAKNITTKGSVINENTIETGNLNVIGNELKNNGNNSLIKADNIVANVNTVENTGDLLALNNIVLTTNKLTNIKNIKALNKIEANNNELKNSGEIVSNKEIKLNETDLANTGKIASNNIEMKDLKNFSNTGEITGTDVILTTSQDVNLVSKLHGENRLTIKARDVVNDGETTGKNLILIDSRNFTNKKDLSAQDLKLKANEKIENKAILSGTNVDIKTKDLVNKDLLASENDLKINSLGKIENQKAKTIYAGKNLDINGNIIENQEGEILANNIFIESKKLTNNIGTIQAENKLRIKSDIVENIGKVDDYNSYESFYETWDVDYLTLDEVNNLWKENISSSYSKRSLTESSSKRAPRRNQKRKYEEIAKRMIENPHPSLLFQKYDAKMRKDLGGGNNTTGTGTADIQKTALKERLISKAKTHHGKILANDNIDIEAKGILNKDLIISTKEIVTINADKLENLVSTSGGKIKVKTGEESLSLSENHRSPNASKPYHKTTDSISYVRDFQNDYVYEYTFPNGRKERSVEKRNYTYLDDGIRVRVPYERIYIGRYGYVTGQPSVIEGKSLDIKVKNEVVQAIDEANGRKRENKPVIIPEMKKETVAQGNSVTNNELEITDKNINREIEVVSNMSEIQNIINTGKIEPISNIPSALFVESTNPTSKYILETRLKYISKSNYYGSDYFLDKIGYKDKWDNVRRLGDAFYENQLVEKTLFEKLGTRFLNGKAFSMKELIDNAEIESKKQNLTIGSPLTREQIANLERDILWYEYQKVNDLNVLAPRVYLSKDTLNNINSSGKNRIAGIEKTTIVANKIDNAGIIGGSGKTYLEADEILNKSIGNSQAEIKGFDVELIGKNSIINQGSKIFTRNNLNLISNGNVFNRTTIKGFNYNFGELNRTRHTELENISEISANNLNIFAKNYSSIAAITRAINTNIEAINVNIEGLKLSGEQKFGKDDNNFNSYAFVRNVGSQLETENLSISADNLNILGSTVIADNALIDAKVLVKSEVDSEDRESRSKQKGFLSSKSKKEKVHDEENSASNLYVKNQGIITKDIDVVGSNLILGDNSQVLGKLTTDSIALNSTYSYEESKKGFSGSIGSGGFSVGYGKSESKLKEKDLTNAKSNLVLGDNVTLNKGAEITATNFKHGNIEINNGNITYGARKDVKDIETSSKSSGINLSVRIKSPALDRAKQGIDSFNQMKSGDILGGIASSTNTVTGIVSGLASNQGTKLPTSAVNKNNSNDDDDDDDKNNQTNTVGKDNLKAAQANNNFYANIGVNLGFNKSSSKSNSHSERAVVTTIKGKDENSSITYNTVKNVEYVGTQAQDTKFIYNNVENINKTAVELNNSYSSTGKSSGISTGVTIGYGDGIQTEGNGVSISASKSKMNSNGTTYQNGRFVNVDEVHNNTKNMTLSGFNQEGGTVTGNIENLTIESKQNTSITKGRTIGGSLSIAPNGMPSGSANYSQTNGERRVVDNASTFIIGDGSNLKVGKVENTAAAIGTSGNGKLSIDEYVGHNLENVDKLKTVGGSVGVSTSGITSLGVNYSDRKQEGITKNTVIGNVEIGKSSGDEINKDLGSMTEITKDRDFKTDINIESQTINYIKNPEKFKEDLQKAKSEITDIGNVVKNTVNLPGEDKRNVFENLRAQRWSTSFYNVTGSRMEELSEKFKTGEINEKQLKEAVRELAKGYGKDIGIDYEVVYLDEKTMPKASEGSTGSAYIVDKKNRKVLIPIDVSKIGDINELLGTLTEEVSHGKDALEGRQDKKVAEDKSNDEEGLESLGRPANDYVKNKLGEDSNSKIKLSTDGIDLSNADVGEKVGDKSNDGYNDYRKDLRIEMAKAKIAKPLTKFPSKTYTEKELQETIDKNYGKGYYKIDWDKYSKDAEYREQTNYYFYQAKHFVKAKTIDKIDEGYIEITRDNGEKLKLTEIKAEEAIYHNIEKINGELYFKFGKTNRYKKFVNEDGYELILDQNNKPVYDPVVVGTYNFHTYKSVVKNPIDFVSHLKDVNLWKKYGTGPNDPTRREEREKIGDLFLGYKIQNNYDEIRNELKTRKKDSVSSNELKEIINKIEETAENKRKKEIYKMIN